MTATTRDRFHRQEIAAVRQLAGVGDQSDACQNGTPGCPGPDAGVGELPCAACFLEGR